MSASQPAPQASPHEELGVMDEEIEQLGLPPCAINQRSRDCFVKNGLAGKRVSMADYCGPCHKLARRACILLVVSEVVGLLLGWLFKAEVWVIVLLLQPLNVIVLCMEWECLKYVLLPWQHTLLKNGSTNFRLPLFSNFVQTGFEEWAAGVSIVSLVVVVSLQNQAVHMGKVLQHKVDFYHQCISGLCFLATFVSLVWVIVWSHPVATDVRWDFDRDRTDKPDEEIRYDTIASQVGLSKWPSTHYEGFIRYAHYAGMFGVQQMTDSLQEAEASLLWYATEDFERKCSTRIYWVMRFNFAMVFCRVFLRTVPQVCLSTWQYHRNWQSWSDIWPLGVNLFVFIFSDCSTFLTAQSIYLEFTSRLLADRDEGEYSPECTKVMENSKRFNQMRWPIMALSAFLISSCLCLVLADWICQPFIVSEGICSLHPQQNAIIPLAMCLLAFLIVIVGVSVMYFVEPLPLWEPSSRKNNKKQYVDEDKPQYYWHIPGQKDVTMIDDSSKKFQHCGAQEKNDSFLKVEGEQFVDDKLLRVQESGQQNDIPKLTEQRKEFLLKDAQQEDWFELALRFGKELTPYQWRQEVAKHPKRKMVKLLGFDGGHPMESGFVSQATNELLDNDVVIWDGDWFCEQGWTNMINTFLKAKKTASAVAFQNRAEVPGFHRSYWQLYKEFPHRVQIVVLNDSAYVCPQPILDKHDWLESEFKKGSLKKPERPANDPKKYLTVAMVGRKFQGETKVISMNGGNITTALFAIETGLNPWKKIQWTVYEAWRQKQDKSERTLLKYATEHASEAKNLKIVRS